MAIASLNTMTVLDLARCEWIERKENVIAFAPSGTGKSHVAPGLGLAACPRGFPVAFVTGAELLFELISQRYERGSTVITGNLPFEEWTETIGTERLTAALLDRHDPSRQHPGNERRNLPSQPKPRPPRRNQ